MSGWILPPSVFSEGSVTIDFQALLARSPNPYVLLDSDLRIVWMNDAYLQVTMRTRDKLLGQNMFDAFPSDPDSESHRQLESSFRRVFASGKQDEIALIRYDIPTPDGGMDVRYWSATHTPFSDEARKVAYILQHTVDVTELQTLRAMRDEMGLIQRANAVQARNLDLAEEAGQFKSLFEQAPGFVAILHGPDHEFRMANAAYHKLVGGRDLLGKRVKDALPEVSGQRFLNLLDQVYRSGKPFIGRRLKVLLQNDEGTEVQERYLDFVYQPTVGEGGTVSGVFVQGHDVTDQVESEERQALLMNELNHRVKNTLAIVQGLAMQSFRQMPGSEVPRQTFNARLAALAAAHNLLTTSNWKTAGFIETVRSAAEASIGEDLARVHLDGRDFTIAPQTAVSLSMIIHELCTNAVKYGALSVPEGHIDLSWTIEDEEEDYRLIDLRWEERGGPPVQQPANRGFGSRLIEHGFSTERASGVVIDFRPTGLLCTIKAKLTNASIVS
ncbi:MULTISPECIES: sensor histidine kinase [unclassified Sphingobium]|uniref:sensor histidine kinase n=1 Tax=unclassified Sphingobium TaxID=2611147 RepID=UPI0022244655|nr:MULTISPECIES: PAS domain-containing protein [unclassified Sphingobium]MCW2351313.1 PAS domain S-box-containing protein [Sphingobium sp. B12D2B]MCW2413113.1 PAS domain S-box-containing protein [Sphingobium sp. B8D3D]MCW2414589.1 PAS domain S-box-containing protein [Sphingobium sp. B8D3A]